MKLRLLTKLPFFFILVFSWGSFAAENKAKVGVINVVDSINVGSAEFIKRATSESQNLGYSALLIKLDTPGGFLEATRDIVQFLLNSEFPVIVWVSPQGARAASAGTMITMAAHYAAMSPATSIGAATPVSGGGKDMPEDMKKKVTNDTLSFVEGIAKKRGRNVEWAKSSVTEAASLTAEQALKENVIDGVHENRVDLWKSFGKKFKSDSSSSIEVQFVEIPMSLSERVLSFFSNPNVAYGLLALGALGIYVEMTNPGIFVPGIIGAIALSIGAISTKIIPIQPGAFILLLIGLILFAIEIFLPVPSFGIAGAASMLCLALSGIFLLDMEQTNLSISWSLWIPALLLGTVFMLWFGYSAARALKSKGYAQGIDALIGERAEVVKVNVNGNAKVRVNGELWECVWTSATVGKEFKKGQTVLVKRQEGFKLFVE